MAAVRYPQGLFGALCYFWDAGFQARIGVEAHAGLCILREELQPLPAVAGEGLGESPRRVVARKLKVLRFLARHSPESLAVAAGVPVERVLAAEGEGGVLELDDLEKLARVLGVKVAELFRAVGRTPEERVLLGVLEGRGNGWCVRGSTGAPRTEDFKV